MIKFYGPKKMYMDLYQDPYRVVGGDVFVLLNKTTWTLRPEILPVTVALLTRQLTEVEVEYYGLAELAYYGIDSDDTL